MSYNVGQILYLLSSENMSVIPVQVVEEITRKTLDGVNISYMIRIPDQKRSEVELSTLKVETYDSLDTLRDHMYRNAQNSIDSLLDNAFTKSRAIFGEPVENIDPVAESIEKVKNTPSPKATEKKSTRKPRRSRKKKAATVQVDLGDGTIANVDKETLNMMGMNDESIAT
jgi:hypothetical protein